MIYQLQPYLFRSHQNAAAVLEQRGFYVSSWDPNATVEHRVWWSYWRQSEVAQLAVGFPTKVSPNQQIIVCWWTAALWPDMPKKYVTGIQQMWATIAVFQLLGYNGNYDEI